jgi:hypothetical protein
MEIDDGILKAIAEQTDMGMKCFLNKETLEVVSYPNEDQLFDFDENEWRDEINKVETNPGNFIEIEPMDSTAVFRAMEWFIDDIKDGKAKDKLTDAITGHKPFANFKLRLHEYPELLNEWYKFKEDCMIDFIKGQLPVN